jgi:hypothetical protein
MRTPVPSPTTPSPGLVIGDQRPDRDPRAKTDQRSRDHCVRGLDINDGRIILRHINHLRIRRLNYIYRLTGRLLYLYLLLGITTQSARGVGLRAQALNRSRDRCLIRVKSLTDGGVIVNVRRHHVQDCRKIY